LQRPRGAAVSRQIGQPLQRHARAAEMREQRAERARPDIIAADQPQPVDPISNWMMSVMASTPGFSSRTNMAQHEGAGKGTIRAPRSCLGLHGVEAVYRPVASCGIQKTLSMISLSDLQRRVATGELSADAALAQSQVAIEALESTIGAFVCRADGPRAQAQGPLRGIAVGIKDIIDTSELPTEMGSPIYQG
jgi:hypothetical protein